MTAEEACDFVNPVLVAPCVLWQSGVAINLLHSVGSRKPRASRPAREQRIASAASPGAETAFRRESWSPER
jgi:hypothetical protein